MPDPRAQSAVPQAVQNVDSFQNWFSTLHSAGHELLRATREWVYRPSGEHDYAFCWALRVAVRVSGEDRIKDNEVVLGRPDVAFVLAYCPAAKLPDCQVVLIREFRSAGASADGFVHELPCGSDGTGWLNARQVALAELAEETGLLIDPGRLVRHHARQLAATFSVHRAHLFSVELSPAELDVLRTDDTLHGDLSASEQTYVEVVRVRELLAAGTADWTTLGAIAEVLLTNR
ncbi:hypothetical protein F9C11_20875 [Amycolatopsis sp. VS8301801F10]|uniref:hypothetical protein n=1 Tax=Amycolatopsis sp. VS8301801F10 TaxID=2652442 RepID=UPI0038FCF09B